ncbi:MAG: hypothetical protein R3C10_05890 [Pirellulales bacterium]
MTSLLADKDVTVRGNAAIALARSGVSDRAVVDELIATVERAATKLSMRQAAAESFAWLAPAAALPSLPPLVDEFASVTVTESGQAVPTSSRSVELHAELLRALTTHVDVTAEPRFTWALSSRSPLVLAAALEAWGATPAAGPGVSAIPLHVVSLCEHASPEVRMRALHVLAVRRHPQVLQRLTMRLMIASGQRVARGHRQPWCPWRR